MRRDAMRWDKMIWDQRGQDEIRDEEAEQLDVSISIVKLIEKLKKYKKVLYFCLQNQCHIGILLIYIVKQKEKYKKYKKV